MTSCDDEKSALRKAAKATRRALHDPVRGAGAAAQLLEVLRPHAGRVIAGYMPIHSEVSPLPAMLGMLGHARLAVPVIQGEGLPLIFREWAPGAQMIDGPFGALVPAEGDFLAPDLIILPLLAFDRRGFRLGYGGGYYDRTLEALNGKTRPLAVGFAYAGQEVPRVPIALHDQPLDLIVTEDGPIAPA